MYGLTIEEAGGIPNAQEEECGITARWDSRSEVALHKKSTLRMS